ncbi:uncharacterized protein L201_002351 [Kwoniella dendrophila CBS 6074]|uniref:Defective in cullin neddylation protein n=1 Tax=Kwoniella dendrophila CBS 6074 TaxID=1295534 RepID=A0AAX4JS71_9TREE
MFFSAAKGQYIQFTKSDWEVFECVLQLCDQYDTSQIAEKLLKHLKPIDIFGVEHLFDLFKIAAKYDDILTATRTIASLRSCGSKEGKKYTLFWSYSQWDEECMKNLPGHWVWACMQAHEETIKGRGADYYWPTVASNFMMILAP